MARWENVIAKLEEQACLESREAVEKVEVQAREASDREEAALVAELRAEARDACAREAAVALAWWMKLDSPHVVDRVDRSLHADDQAASAVDHHGDRGDSY